MTYQLHEVLATLWGDDPQVRLTAANHLWVRWWRLSRGNFAHTVAIGYWQQARGGSGADVAVCWKDRKKRDSETNTEGQRRWCVVFSVCVYLWTLCVSCLIGCVRSSLLCLCVFVLISEPSRSDAPHAPPRFHSSNSVCWRRSDFLQLLHIKPMSRSLHNYFIHTLSTAFLFQVISSRHFTKNKHRKLSLDFFYCTLSWKNEHPSRNHTVATFF